MTGQRQDLLACSRSTTWASPTQGAPPSTGTPRHGVRLKLMRTTTTSPELAPGDTVRNPALFKVCHKVKKLLQIVLSQRRDLAPAQQLVLAPGIQRPFPPASPLKQSQDHLYGHLWTCRGLCVCLPVQLHGRVPLWLHHHRRGHHTLVLDAD